MKCVNCGKRIVEKNEDESLCKKCSRCTTLYEARIRRLKQKMISAVWRGLFVLVIGLLVYFKAGFSGHQMIGLLLFYYAAANVLFPAATSLSEYVQLRMKVKEELQEKS